MLESAAYLKMVRDVFFSDSKFQERTSLQEVGKYLEEPSVG